MKFPIIHVELANSTPCPRPAVPTEFLISKSNKLPGVSIIDLPLIFILDWETQILLRPCTRCCIVVLHKGIEYWNNIVFRTNNMLNFSNLVFCLTSLLFPCLMLCWSVLSNCPNQFGNCCSFQRKGFCNPEQLYWQHINNQLNTNWSKLKELCESISQK